MLTALRQPDATKVFARSCERGSGPFRCPACGTEALLVKGRLRIHHFRHRPDATQCARGLGESLQHLACKEAIHAALQGCVNVADIDVERPTGRNIADVYAVIDGTPVAIEIQRSIIDLVELERRTLEYHRLGVHVLWLGLPGEEIAWSEYAPRAWERWCHALYGGRAYFWIAGQTVLPVHFGPCRIRPAPYVCRDARGVETVFGGHPRLSKQLATPHHGPRLDIAEAFSPRRQGGSRRFGMEIPPSSIYADRVAPWWSG